MMRAVIAPEFGGIDTLELRDVDRPLMRSHGVRISVRSAGVSFANLLAIEGRHQNRAVPPFIPGTEIAGVIAELADDASGDFNVGDRVCAGLPNGGFAEEAVAQDDNVFRIPDAIDYSAATLFPTIYATAYCALNWRAALMPGETLLVHGAAGASGLAAVEIGAAMGAQVIATAGGEAKCAAVRQRGAAHVIDHKQAKVREAVLELTGGRGVDVVFDPVGGDLFDDSLRCIAPLGRILTIGYASGRIPNIPANLLLVKNISVIGLYWGYYMAWGKTRAPPVLLANVRTMFREMFALLETGALRPKVDRELPLTHFAEGLKRVEDRSVIGKIVLLP